jgi:phosphopantothenoylcysteine decarboxylase/phosphopantothenate--cysteine ligase
MSPLLGKKILLGVTGSISAYQSADLARKLFQEGAVVQTLLTDAATRFITPITFQSLTGQRVYTDRDLWGNNTHGLHLGLVQQANIMLIAPATASSLAKIANGIADNLLTLTALACGSGNSMVPMIVAPAMEPQMWTHEATQNNIRILSERGVLFTGFEEENPASGLIFKGGMTEPSRILGFIRYHISRNGPLENKRIIITAGGTQEDIDPVRYITNRSSGKQGFALAQAALDKGADVTLIAAGTNLSIPTGADYIAIRNTAELRDATISACQDADALIMAAAVSDFRPIKIESHKIKKSNGIPSIPLEPTVDILKEVSAHKEQTCRPVAVIGFSAETKELIENTKVKLQDKKLNFLVATNVSEVDAESQVNTNQVTILFADGRTDSLPLLTKTEVAERIIAEVIHLLRG